MLFTNNINKYFGIFSVFLCDVSIFIDENMYFKICYQVYTSRTCSFMIAGSNIIRLDHYLTIFLLIRYVSVFLIMNLLLSALDILYAYTFII